MTIEPAKFVLKKDIPNIPDKGGKLGTRSSLVIKGSAAKVKEAERSHQPSPSKPRAIEKSTGEQKPPFQANAIERQVWLKKINVSTAHTLASFRGKLLPAQAWLQEVQIRSKKE